MIEDCFETNLEGYSNCYDFVNSSSEIKLQCKNQASLCFFFWTVWRVVSFSLMRKFCSKCGSNFIAPNKSPPNNKNRVALKKFNICVHLQTRLNKTGFCANSTGKGVASVCLIFRITIYVC